MNARVVGVLRSKKMRLVAVALLVLGLAGGGVVIWKRYQAGTVEFAISALNTAIATKNTEQLAHLVRFDRLADKLATQILATSPEIVSDDASREYADTIQHALFQVFSGKLEEAAAKDKAPEKEKGGEKGSEKGEVKFQVPPSAPLEDEVFAILKKPVPVLPANLQEQLTAQPFTLQASDGQLAVAVTTVLHPRLELSVPLRLIMRRTGSTWQVDELGNAEQIIKEFMERVNEKKREAEEAFEAENSRQRSLIDTYYHVESCRAVVFPASATNDLVRLRITISGRNMGDRDLVAAAALCELRDKEKKISTLRLESPRRVSAGEEFEQSWIYNFETRFPEVDKLLGANNLTCVATPITASLGGSKLLYPRSIKELPGVRFE